MGYFLRSIQDEYDKDGNYIGNSPQGNKLHQAEQAGSGVVICSACNLSARRPHSAGGTVCADCGCGESKKKYR